MTVSYEHQRGSLETYFSFRCVLLNMLKIRAMIDHVGPSWPECGILLVAGTQAILEAKACVNADDERI